MEARPVTGGESPAVLLSCYACAPGTGTEPGVGWATAWYLSQAGYRVTVMTRMGNRAAIEEERTRQDDGWPTLAFHYLDLPHPLRGLREASGPHYLLWQIRALFAARRLIRRQRFDIIHHVTYASLQGSSWLWMLGLPFIFGPAGGAQTAPPQAERYFGSAWTGERRRSLFTSLLPYSPLHRLLARRSAVMLAANTQTAQVMRRLGARNVQLMLDSGLPDDMLSAGSPARGLSGPLRILWVGRLLKRKAIRLALDAVSRLDVPFHLTVVGDGTDADALSGWLRERKLEERVTVTGRIPWQQVMTLYREHDVFLFTSLRDSFGTQLLEAASQGLPIVCLDHHGAGDFLPASAAIKVPLGAADALATDLASALGHFARLSPADREAMGEAGLSFARAHRWVTKTAGYRRLYSELTAQ